MAQTMVNFRMDEKLKEKMEKTCKDEENMDRLRKNMAQMEKTGGTAHEVNLDD